MTPKPFSKGYKAEMQHYEREGLSKISLSWIMDYEDWKLAFAENLKRYDQEKKAKGDFICAKGHAHSNNVAAANCDKSPGERER